MTAIAQEILKSFDSLPSAEQVEIALEMALPDLWLKLY
jgi:hypothetical protein